MILATEATATFTAAEFLLALIQAAAFVAAIVVVKLVPYRRRLKEIEAANLRYLEGRPDRHPWYDGPAASPAGKAAV